MSEPWDKFLDHPKLRAHTRCVICGGYKTVGLVVCWQCYRDANLRYGNDTVERFLDEEEKKL